MGGAKFYRFALFPLMLLMLLFVPTRMVAETTTEDPRYVLFKGLEGITDVTITDNGSYPWQELDLNAEGMTNLGFTIPEGSKGLMSSNYNVDGSSSETVVNFTVEKPMLLTFKYLVSSEYNFDKATITLDNKEPWTISDKKQIEIKALLSVGEHSLKLSYTKDGSGNEYADRTCIYDLKTATTFSEYVADYVATNSTLTFKKITSDNLEGLDLSRLAMVDNIDGVQDVCTNYSSIKNIVFDESFKTYAPTSLREFFKGCETLETISDLEYLNTAKVTDIGKMFHGCSALTSLDLTNFNTANVEFMDNMFEGCSALKSLDLTNFNTAKVTYMSCMFKGCSALESLNLTNFNTENVTDMSWMFYGCSALKSLDLTNFNTAKVTYMIHMFYGCSALKSLDLTNFNTAKVTYMNNMFEGCSALTTIYVSNKFVTDNVSNGSDMFTGCKSLKDYSDSKTDHTYANCGTTGYFTPVFDYAEFDNATGTLTFRRSLSKPAGAYDLNVESNDPGWNAQSANIKKVVFDASFANARPTSCCRWFADCFYLTEIEGIENLNTQNVTDMSWMFTCCYALTSLDVSNFNTQNVEDMTDMFLGCEGLSLLDLSNFNTERVENMSSMFSGCSTLQTIFASDKFVTDQVFGGDDMFIGCENLKGFIDYISDSGKDNNKYANYKTGYFTKLVGKNGEKKIGATGDALTTENLVLDDGKDFVAYEPFAAKAASYNRTINPGTTWATLCLPFEVSLENQNFRAFKLLSADDVAETVELEEIETSIAAGTPVIIKMKDGANSLSISEADKAIAKDVQASETANGNYQLQGIYTQKVFDKDADNNCYIVKGNKLMNPAKLLENSSTTQVGSKPFRAYMVDNTTAPAAGAKMFSIAIGGGTTAIDSLNTIADDKAVYYDLQGNRLNAPQKGINIVKRGGKTMKVIIK
ncbi:BspA family leucine-rich repeat surface protein [Segatella copri]|uniref:BspA family leucine-rich repeat surface protein n=1 Tax=Segatella copri TaxID=165179 RepID=UPI003F72BE94